MAALSLDIIDKIFTANQNTIVSTYLAFAQQRKHIIQDSSTTGSRKRSRVSSDNRADRSDKQINIYLLNPDTYMKYYQQSSWFKYLIPISDKLTASKKSKAKSRARVNTNSIDNNIQKIANYFHQLDTNMNCDTKEQTPDMPDMPDLLEAITRFETILDTSEFSPSHKYESQLEALRQYYTGMPDIPVFVSMVLMLYNCGYFISSSGGNRTGSHIHPFLDMILEGESAKITEFLQTYKYYSARYEFIPLFCIYLGMGYSFVIGWENEFNSMIGITENGGDYHEVLYNTQRAIRYFTAREIFLKMNRKDLQKEYMKMLGIKDISILLEYSRRLNICDMF